MRDTLLNKTYLENNGFPFDLRHVLENGIDNGEELVPIQRTGLILLEEVDEVVQDEVRS